jgi:enoyl-[acyl-carrier protein] reductase/trans-2-enoyl-CoA reductase (NAD+)
MVRSNVCINSHPTGCAVSVRKQIEYAKKELAGRFVPAGAPKLALVIGCSTGYGLASRIAAAFGYGAATVGISFEKAASATKPGTPGWYNNLTFDTDAEAAGLISRTLNGDAFSDAMKDETVAVIKEVAAKAKLEPRADLIVYSLASPVRVDPVDGAMYKSVIKPIGQAYTGTTLDMMSARFITASVESAVPEEIAHTIKVMGGEDWERWISCLDAAGVLAKGVRTVAYTYIGPKLSWAIYKNGTIGKAKEDLERAGRVIDKKLKADFGGAAWISVNKALVTRASAVIPVIPFYVSSLFKVMKEKGIHEGCIEQIVRLYRERLYSPDTAEDSAKVPVDSEGRIRIDDWEMREDVQKEVMDRMSRTTEDNVLSLTDIAGFRKDFMEAHGFDVDGVDYDADVDPSTI